VIGDRWGVSDEEVARHYPCDDLVARPTLEAWRGVTVRTSAAHLWPWLVQVRWAPYSYDWIDNRGRRSPRELIDGPPPQPGDAYSRSGGRPVGRILAVEPGVSYTATILGAFMTYELVPVGDRETRLLLKIVGGGRRWLAPFVSAGDLVMARKQLLNLRDHAERASA
jgi:hypothetical protein